MTTVAEQHVRRASDLIAAHAQIATLAWLRLFRLDRC
jgi:hypothetical protein